MSLSAIMLRRIGVMNKLDEWITRVCPEPAAACYRILTRVPLS